jgi:hypothetical protein
MVSYDVQIGGWDGEGWLPITVNGERFHTLDNDDGCRSLAINEDRTLLLKYEGRRGLRQFAIEAQIWQTIEEEDRKYFAAIIAAGEAENTGWVLTEYYDDLIDHDATQEQVRLADSLARKYEITDWDYGDAYYLRQWKVRPDGSVIIHDFGISGKRDSSKEIEQMEFS